LCDGDAWRRGLALRTYSRAGATGESTLGGGEDPGGIRILPVVLEIATLVLDAAEAAAVWIEGASGRMRV